MGYRSGWNVFMSDLCGSQLLFLPTGFFPLFLVAVHRYSRLPDNQHPWGLIGAK